jgi:hypothetical protein
MIIIPTSVTIIIIIIITRAVIDRGYA